ncbi:hypothetical protein LBMAG56_23910 [Verrucomicrobiota bacterium]|nr:hypothetical protein LBMAG56_23910 [Verrucomicrobiota bacterium]
MPPQTSLFTNVGSIVAGAPWHAPWNLRRGRFFRGKLKVYCFRIAERLEARAQYVQPLKMKTSSVFQLVFFAAAALLVPELAALAAEVVRGAAPPDAPFQLGKFLAPFHSVVLHYPIGFVTLAVILEVYSRYRPSPELRRVIALVMGLAAVSCVVAAAFGILRARGGGYDDKTVEVHRWTGIAVTALTIIGWFVHQRVLRDLTRVGILKLYRVLIAADLVILVIAGHEGGNLTHGSNYLFEGAPGMVKFAKDIMEDTIDSPPVEVPVEESKRVFVEKIRPILEAKCIKCHGPDKMKGNYRLDVGEIALRGGESGKTAIKPGDAFQSHLARVILLPKDHDDVMPPSGKGLLTTEEIVTIINWIQEGAPFADFGVLAKTDKPVPAPEPKPDTESVKPAAPATPADVVPARPPTPEPAPAPAPVPPTPK